MREQNLPRPTSNKPHLIPLRSREILEQAIQRSHQEPVVLYKHSAACALSYRARHEMEALNKPDDPPVYEVVVQYDRALSSEIEERFGIRHESPQAIVFHEGKPVFHTSHRGVTCQAVKRAARQAVSTA